ncbi:Hypothetical predicted protein, partial [Paramuricea clavata]
QSSEGKNQKISEDDHPLKDFFLEWRSQTFTFGGGGFYETPFPHSQNCVAFYAIQTLTMQPIDGRDGKSRGHSFVSRDSAVKGDFTLNVRATMIKRRELLLLDNPHNEKRIEAHQHLRDIELEDHPTKERLPVHVILGANEYAKIRTSQVRIGRQGEPVAELTRYGWALMSPGADTDPSVGCLAVNTALDHEQLCALDVLGLADSPAGDQDVVYQEFREQLKRNADEGWYETRLPWKGDHPPLPSYRNGSIRRLHTQVRKLRKMGKLEDYDAIIREQLNEGIVERAPNEAVGREFYMPHRAVIREGAESTKMRVVYDCSAREGEGSPSLNDCLDIGPPLQNKLWDVLAQENNDEITYAKEQLGSSADECKLLGLAWNKREDTLSVTFPEEKSKPTKREVLGKLARVYDPLGLLASETTKEPKERQPLNLSRALHLELLLSLETAEFLGALKRFIARRGRPTKIYSDNDKAISWQFNLSRAPCRFTHRCDRDGKSLTLGRCCSCCEVACRNTDCTNSIIGSMTITNRFCGLVYCDSCVKQLAELDVKLKALTFRTKRSDEVIEKGEKTAVERQKGSIVAIGENEADIEQWSRDIEAQVTIADQSYEGYERAMKYLKEKYGHPSEIAGSRPKVQRRTSVQAVKTTTRQISTLMGTTRTKMSQFDLSVEAVKCDFTLNVRATMIKRRELLLLDNPHNEKRIEAHQHLRDIELGDHPTKERLPVHVILGANEYAKIRTSQVRIGRQGEPVAELTRYGWALMSPGADTDPSVGCLAVNTALDHEQLCALDVLGLADSPAGDQDVVYQEFREQLKRNADEGWYETRLPWKGDHPPLPSYRNGSIRRLHTQVRKLRKMGKLEDYDAIIREQLNEGIVEHAPNEAVGREFYMPHRAVIREGAESTKMRVVYDCSAREGEGSPSLNDCLDIGPPLQNKLWDVLVRGRFHPIALAGDLRKAFLQVRVLEQHLRRQCTQCTVALHWICGGGEYRQFVANRVQKIQEHKIDAWMHVPTADNPADLGSRGGSVEDSELWWNGPEWLSNRDLWPPNLVTKESAESATEAKAIREVLAVTTVAEPDEFDSLLAKYDLKRTLRVCVWISRFVRSCRGAKRAGPITTAEMDEQMKWWICRVQRRAKSSARYLDERLQLNLQENDEVILECRVKLVEEAH